jgi:hypothetical protein
MRAADLGKTAHAVVVRSWPTGDGGWRGQVRQQVSGKSSTHQPVHEVAFDAKPRDGSTVLIRQTGSDGWRVVY